MPKLIDLTGRVFGRWAVIEHAGCDKRRHSLWLCQCSCPLGTQRVVNGSNLRQGLSQSCGCLQSEAAKECKTTHGHSTNPTPEYRSWRAMKERCTNPKNSHYEMYGGRGIQVCERWNDFANFLADMGERPDGMSLDRWPDTNGDYAPGNCRWATTKQQARNTRSNRVLTINQMSLCVVEWAELIGEHTHTIAQRLYRGWPELEAVFGRQATK